MGPKQHRSIRVLPTSLLLAGGPIQLGTNEGLTEESNHSDLAVGD